MLAWEQPYSNRKDSKAKTSERDSIQVSLMQVVASSISHLLFIALRILHLNELIYDNPVNSFQYDILGFMALTGDDCV